MHALASDGKTESTMHHHLEEDSSVRHPLPRTERSLVKDQPLLRNAFHSIHLHPVIGATESFDQFFDKIESILLKYPRDPGRAYAKPVHMRPKSIHLSRSECMHVWQQYFTLRNAAVPEAVRHSLTLHTFNNWLYSDAQLLVYLRLMFMDLELPEKCKFPTEILEAWLLALYRRYNNVPFHNFKHAFAVTQMMYSIIKQAELVTFFSAHELLALMFSALSHDLDHPGFTNSYQINVGSWLALRYNDNSPLENHHCAVAFDLISCPYTNLLCGMNSYESRWFRKVAIRCILATDMSSHDDCMQRFRQLLPALTRSAAVTSSYGNPQTQTSCCDWDGSCLREYLNEDANARLTVMLILLKVCDLSNEVRPPAVADPWLDCLLDEFFYQARAERRLGLPVAAHMDPDKVTRCSSQTAFLTGVLLPLLSDVVAVFPKLEPLLIGAKERILYFQSHPSQSSQQVALITTQSLLTHITDSPFIGRRSHGVARLSHLDDGQPVPRESAALSVVGEPTATATSSGAHISSGLASCPPGSDDNPQSIIPLHYAGTISEVSPTPLPLKDRSVSEPSGRHSSQQAVIGTPTTTTTLLCSGFGSVECDIASNSDMFSDNAPSRKSSTGSMVVASS